MPDALPGMRRDSPLISPEVHCYGLLCCGYVDDGVPKELHHFV